MLNTSGTYCSSKTTLIQMKLNYGNATSYMTLSSLGKKINGTLLGMQIFGTLPPAVPYERSTRIHIHPYEFL